MHLALNQSQWLDKLVVVDMPPLPLSNRNLIPYFDALSRLESQTISSIAHADSLLMETIAVLFANEG
jgi:hypothetical protein